MSYTIFGGPGAGRAAGVAAARSERPSPTAESAGPAPAEATSLKALASREYGEDPSADDSWVTIASVMPEQGDHVGDTYVFRLEIVGLSGDDGNLYEPTVSLRDRRNVAPEGLAMLDWAPTVRIPRAKIQTEVAFDVPADAEQHHHPQFRCGLRQHRLREHLADGAGGGLGPGRLACRRGDAAAERAGHHGLRGGLGRRGDAQRPHALHHRSERADAADAPAGPRLRAEPPAGAGGRLHAARRVQRRRLRRDALQRRRRRPPELSLGLRRRRAEHRCRDRSSLCGPRHLRGRPLCAPTAPGRSGTGRRALRGDPEARPFGRDPGRAAVGARARRSTFDGSGSARRRAADRPL